MWFRLAARLGKTVSQLQSEMSSSEFAEWIAAENIGIFDEMTYGGTAAIIAHGANQRTEAEHFAAPDFFPKRPWRDIGLKKQKEKKPKKQINKTVETFRNSGLKVVDLSKIDLSKITDEDFTKCGE